MSRGSRLFGTLALLLAFALFIVTVRQAGLADILHRVSAMGGGFVAILMIAGIRVAVRSLAWLISLPRPERRIGFPALFEARLIGDAAGHLTPAGPLVGEPARLAALGKRLPLATRLHSLAIETLTYSLSSCLMVIAGTVAMLGSVALGQRLRFAGILASASMLLVVGATILVVLRRW
ncbi:MAG: lysylphosphatidylglycerol synthase domain-containing protein, partial [Acidobacteriota bacterium]